MHDADIIHPLNRRFPLPPAGRAVHVQCDRLLQNARKDVHFQRGKPRSCFKGKAKAQNPQTSGDHRLDEQIFERYWHSRKIGEKDMFETVYFYIMIVVIVWRNRDYHAVSCITVVWKKTLQTMAVLYLDDSHYPAFTSFCSATKFDEWVVPICKAAN